FNMNDLTAAHPTLPFGTRLCAHSPSTGKSVIVRINDRGPFVKHRIIDFSKAAAQALGILHSRPDVVALLDSSDKRCFKG
ncbi:MAG: septal ring lytic transglycosylase RlpA family protein, partial [Rhodoferax sp.]